LNAERHPESWRVWYSLAEAYKAGGDGPAAIDSYEKALEADPFNNLAPWQRESLEELRRRVAGSG
jgi:tetratricopeptide (TPR) repeat protein